MLIVSFQHIKFISIFGTFKKWKVKKVCKWMNSYTSKTSAQSCLEKTQDLLVLQDHFYGDLAKNRKKVELIINEDSITGIDIHNKFDLEMARFVFKYLKKIE